MKVLKLFLDKLNMRLEKNDSGIKNFNYYIWDNNNKNKINFYFN